MGTYQQEYAKLNDAQREAVDAIDGPVIVIAGPGTGKTQLLAMRVANILQKTDVLPNNILCLTFSESGREAMRSRLASLMPATGQQVDVYTFHGFGSEIMARYPDFFYRGATRRAADELKQYELLQSIFQTFERDHILYGYREERFTQLKSVDAKIKEFKKAGLQPNELRMVLEHNESFLDFAEPLLNRVIGGQTITKALIASFSEIVKEVQAYTAKPLATPFIPPLHQLFIDSLQRALTASAALDGRHSTKPLTEWKNIWRDATAKGIWRFKARGQHTKLAAVIDVYEAYQTLLTGEQLYDYEDMIIEALNGLESNEALRNSLQEQYQYILVDEYQDTNQAQLRMVRALADHPVHEGRPNIMVVGDDDQAIYKFQGADLNNMIEFIAHYKHAKRITLTGNYRSGQAILDFARQIITQGQERLENAHPEITKSLIALGKSLPSDVVIKQPLCVDQMSEYAWIAAATSKAISDGVEPKKIAIIGRWHNDLLSLVPYLKQAGVPFEYERRENILHSPHIIRLVRISMLVDALAHHRYDDADALLPEVLTYDFWQINKPDLWAVSFTAHRQHKTWLEVLTDTTNVPMQRAVNVLQLAAEAALEEPLESVIDLILGPPTSGDKSSVMRSPYYQYYFASVARNPSAGTYTELLSQLITIRRHLRDFKPGTRLHVQDFIDFVRLHHERSIGIIDTHAPNLNAEAVQVLTAHKAKGLEFDVVFVINCLENVWGRPDHSHTKLIKYPPNLLVLEPAGDTPDDWLRLFFVAITRARSALYLPTYRLNTNGTPTVQLQYTAMNDLVVHSEPKPLLADAFTEALQTRWTIQHVDALHPEKQSLIERLSAYHLSTTHLDRFLNLQYAGPEFFVARNFLQFPSAISPSAAFGNAMHVAMKHGHYKINNGEALHANDLFTAFTQALGGERLSAQNEAAYLEKGRQCLDWLMNTHSQLFKPDQISEKHFGKNNSVLGNARLTGSLDLLEVSGNNIHVVDYKTGRPEASWSLLGEPKDLKLYGYKRQLMFYKLLVENSNDLAFRNKKVTSGELIFLEPAHHTGELVRLSYRIQDEDVSRLKQLIGVVWQHIMDLNFPDVSSYSNDLKGTKQFEDDLISGKV